MLWDWWVLIAIALIAFVAFKMWCVSTWLKKRQKKTVAKEKRMGDDD